jgi:hypothetical protein
MDRCNLYQGTLSFHTHSLHLGILNAPAFSIYNFAHVLVCWIVCGCSYDWILVKPKFSKMLHFLLGKILKFRFCPHLNLSDITSKICTIAMFLFVDLQVICNTEIVVTFVIYVLTRFQIPNSNGSLVIAIKLKLNVDFMHPPYCCLTF